MGGRWGICECRAVSVVARMRCVELVAEWIIGDVGAVYEGGDSEGLAKWMEGGVGGVA